MMNQKKKYPDWLKIVEVIIIFIVLPTFIFYLLAIFKPSGLRFIYYFLVSLITFQGVLALLNAFVAFKHRSYEDLSPSDCSRFVPKTTFLVSAYLPNEIDVVEETLINILKNLERPAGGIEVILDYNTPHRTGLESRLRELAYKYPELILANVYHSKSKSENLNYALSIASGEMIVLLDADHVVNRDCLKRAWRWIEKGYDVVQGRCKIRNGDNSFIASLVEVEFELIYGVAHFAKFYLFDTSLFGGSNGYWKAKTLKSTMFRTDMLTEDIDATLRSVLSGCRIIHDRTIISTELSPETLPGLWKQRKRWAQGWFQCTLKYQLQILRSKLLKIRQKFLWGSLLIWGVDYDIAVHFLFPVVFAYWLYLGRVELPVDWFIITSLAITLTCGPLETLVAYKNAVPPKNIMRYIIYALVSFPYTIIRNMNKLVAMRDEIFRERHWEVTKR